MTDQLTIRYGIEYPTADGTELARFTEDSIALWTSRNDAQKTAYDCEARYHLPTQVVEIISGSVIQ